ncbi:SDR family NAD(P)-dependent oxidoreductase [Legionella anisa]|uniref:SDR family oxidoreductase n=1 Tax=Legionella anisa TaxID=28082 RepID=A0AAX0WVI7_9GAMM|nr:SDR family NAD(P)-dependent oxidoreductase [Legionella anisa]AWN73936.1 SDR family oxidoreductase [Legionella anisa]KTC67204.1 polysaccharide biosynthesis dehydrogenase/reductase [Legionella anisa]MBN5936642.1 SDR family NAD(P)-dependent oxidoreductase [Legionella anisa]MCW8426051.1 SDR family NAD(P)-dependent oxidoreductase [Legionella anisa]MCW8448512.1 SDR family NAD(P)-dependent oxidoreductase [Legionella anisa]
MNEKTILITGASRGIGEQLAILYAAPNINLILVARDLNTLDNVSRRCQEQGANTIYESIDVQNATQLKKFIIEVDNKMPIDLVIANAGISSTLQPNWQPEKEEHINQVFAINLQGTMNTVTPLIPRMIERKKGQIAMMSSIAGLRGLPQSPSYCASKAALHIYGQSLRAWLIRYQIHVNVICPGYIKTDMSDRLTGLKPFLMSSEKAAKMIQKGLLKNKASIVFPWPLHMLIKLAHLLPSRPVDAILNRYESYIS